MLLATGIPYGQMTPPALAVISHGLPSDTTHGSIPSRTVYSAIALPALQNQREGQGPLRASAGVPAMATGAPPTAFSLAQLANPGGSPDHSVAFFAQLLAQSGAETQAELTSSFSGPVPLRPGDPTLLTMFSEIKYMPSGARITAPAVPAEAESRQSETQAPLPAPREAPVASATGTVPPQLADRAYSTAAVLRQGVVYTPIQFTLPKAPKTEAAEAPPRFQNRAASHKEAFAAYAKAAARAVAVNQAKVEEIP